MGLLTDIYNSVAKFFRQQDEQTEGDASKSVATNRLKLVLMQDRTNLTPKVLEQMRGELVDLLSKYLEMDKDLLELNFEHEGDQVALMLSIPVIRAKDEDEIEEALNSSSEEDQDEDDSDDEVDSEDSDEESTDDEVVDSEETSEESSEQEEAPKPKRKRRTKKVSAPEGVDESHTEEENSQTEESENSEIL